MKILNISGNFTPKKKLSKKEFLKRIKNNQSVISFYEDKNYIQSDKLTLGHDGNRYTLYMEHSGSHIELSIYLQLNHNNKEIELIESFSGIDHFIDIEKYERKIYSIIKQSANSDILYNIDIVGQSKNS